MIKQLNKGRHVTETIVDAWKFPLGLVKNCLCKTEYQLITFLCLLKGWLYMSLRLSQISLESFIYFHQGGTEILWVKPRCLHRNRQIENLILEFTSKRGSPKMPLPWDRTLKFVLNENDYILSWPTAGKMALEILSVCPSVFS